MWLVVLILVAYLAPFLVAIPLFHLGRFDPDAPITYTIFALVLPMTVAALWYLFHNPSPFLMSCLTRYLPPRSLARGWVS
jgi:hypothetical protein